MKCKFIKVISIILTLVMLLNLNYYTVYAETAKEKIDKGLLDPTEYPDVWNPNYYISGQNGEHDVLFEKAGIILGAINVIGVAASIIALMIIGIKYMSGSVEERAEYKQELVPYVLGAIFLFASTTMANIIYNLATKLF